MNESGERRQIMISPSDFAFLWAKDPYGFHEKYHHQIKRPKNNMPLVVSEIDGCMKGSLEGKNLKQLDHNLPSCKIIMSDSWVQSNPISVGDLDIIIRGRIDAALEFDNGTYGVIDYKASNKDGLSMHGYTRQLQGYAYALMNNNPRDVHLSPISRLGVLQYRPNKFNILGNGKASLDGQLEWIEINNDMSDFVNFLIEEIAPFLMRDEVEPKGNDQWVNYVNSFYMAEDNE
jgi:hypothetical protein